MDIYTTGNKTVDAVGQINFTGNVIPQAWFSTIIKPNGKPNLRAMMFLADIVYWYRPTEIRDEITGSVTAYKKKMKSDTLQRSYKHLMDQFGCSKTEAVAAVVDLEKLGVIRREFRTEIHNGVCSNNIMYLTLNVDVLKLLTFPQPKAEICNDTPIHKNMDSSPPVEAIPVQKNTGRVSGNKVTATHEYMETNTEIISKNSTKISHKNTQSINPPDHAVQLAVSMDGLSEDELREIVEDDLFKDNSIPLYYRADGRMLVAIKTLTDWYELTPKHFTSEFEHAAHDMVVDCLAEMACADGIQTYKGSTVSAIQVIEQINNIARRDGSLYDFVEQTADDYIQAASREEIRDKRKYMKSVIWNSFLTYRVKFESDYVRTYGHG